VTLAAFWPVRLNGFIEYDDQDYVTANAQVQRGLSWEGVAWAFQTGHAANWHPLTWLSHMLDVQLFGLNSAGHHLTSVLFHIANATLLFLLLRRTTGATWRSAFVAVLFAVHPLHVESVAWVAERKDVLSTFFGLLAIWAYACYAEKSKVQSPTSKLQSPESGVRNSRPDVQGSGFEVQGSRFPSVASGLQLPSWVLYVLSLGLFAFSLMSKPMLVTLPFLLLLLDYWPLGRWQPGSGTGRKARHLLLEMAPFLILSILSILATLHVQQAAMSFYRQLPFPLRAANAVISCVRYLGKTLWPEDLAIFYPLPAHWPAWAVLGSALLVTTLSMLALVGSRKRPYLPVGWFWFLGLLVPVLGLVQVGVQSMADRYTYLPLVGIFIILAWAGTECLETLRIPVRPRIIAAGLLLSLCAALTHSQLRFWRSTEAIFTHAIAVTQDNWLAHYNLAVLALRRYQDTQRGTVEKQVVTLGTAPRSPSESGPAPRDYLAEIVFHCQETLRSKPGYPDPRVTLAKALTEQGRIDEARAQLELAARLDPNNAETHQNLAEILQRQGRVADAISEYKAALKLRPDWEPVLNNLAWMLATHPGSEVRNGAEAVRLARHACALTSRTNLWFLHTLAAAYAEIGDFPQAVTAVEEARRLAAASGRPELAALAETRLELYKARQPMRSP